MKGRENMTCRFIEEYANFKIKLLEKRRGCEEIYGISDTQIDKGINKIKTSVKAARKGIITVDECMMTIAQCFY